jgi:hypothetical protein
VRVSIQPASDAARQDRGAARERRAGFIPYTTNQTALAAAIVVSFALGIYVRTMLPGVGFWDTAEAQTVPPTLSIFHPTGFPLYAMLGWMWSHVPIGEVAYRMNLLSAVSVALSAGLVVLIIGLLLDERHRIGTALAAGIGGLTYALAGEPWDNALRAEVHAVNVPFVAAVIWLMLMWRAAHRAGSPKAGGWLAGAALVFGLGVGVHPITGLLAFGIAPFLFTVDRWIWRRWRLVGACAGLLLIGLASYLYIPIRGQIDPEPPLFYGRPENWEGVRYVIFAEQFRGLFNDFSTPLADLGRKWRDAQPILGAQFVAPAWLAAGAGMVVLAVRHAGVGVLFALVAVATLLYAMNFRDGDIHRYYLPIVVVASVSIGVAISTAAGYAGRAAAQASRRTGSAAARRRFANVGAAIVLLAATLMPVGALVSFYEVRDRSDDREATRWVQSVHAALPDDAVIISWWSYSTPLWYHRWVLGERPDVTIIDERNIIDDGYGTWNAAIDAYLGERPVFLVPPHWRAQELQRHWETETIPTYPGYTRLLRIEGRAQP